MSADHLSAVPDPDHPQDPVDDVAAVWTEDEVEEARALWEAEEAPDAKRRFAYWLLAKVPMGETKAKSGAMKRVADLAHTIDAAPGYLMALRDVAHAWPEEFWVAEASWHAHAVFTDGGRTSAAWRRDQMLNHMQRDRWGRITGGSVKRWRGGSSSAKPSRTERIGEYVDVERKASQKLIGYVDRYHGVEPVPKRSRSMLDRAKRLALSRVAVVDALLAEEKPDLDEVKAVLGEAVG